MRKDCFLGTGVQERWFGWPQGFNPAGMCSVPDLRNKVNIAVKQVKWIFLVSQCI